MFGYAKFKDETSYTRGTVLTIRRNLQTGFHRCFCRTTVRYGWKATGLSARHTRAGARTRARCLLPTASRRRDVAGISRSRHHASNADRASRLRSLETPLVVYRPVNFAIYRSLCHIRLRTSPLLLFLLRSSPSRCRVSRQDWSTRKKRWIRSSVCMYAPPSDTAHALCAHLPTCAQIPRLCRRRKMRRGISRQLNRRIQLFTGAARDRMSKPLAFSIVHILP